MAAMDTQPKMSRQLQRRQSRDLIGFNLKMLAKGPRRSMLVSAGSQDNKQYLLEACRKMAEIGVGLYATPGTHRFLAQNGIESSETLWNQPTIRALITDGKVDFVVNIRTGDTTYDEASDAAGVRSLCVKHGIPLYTDQAVARETIELVLSDLEKGTYKYAIRSDDRPWDLRARFLEMVRQRGGWSNHHAHFDKAYLISPANLALGFADMEKKMGALSSPEGELHARRSGRAYFPWTASCGRSGLAILPDHG